MKLLGFVGGTALLIGVLAGPVQSASLEPNWTPKAEIDLGTDELASMAKAGGYLWVAESWQSGRLFRVDPSTGYVRTVSSGTVGITLQEFQGRLFMAGWEGANPGSLAELSPVTGQVLNRVRVCPGGRDGPTNFWVDDDEIVVACKSGTVSVVSASGLTPLRSADLGTWLTGSTVHGNELWVGSYWGSVYVLDRATLGMKATLSGCPEAWNLWTSGASVLCQGLSSVVSYSATSRVRQWSVNTPVSGYGAYRFSDEILVSGYHDGKVGLIDTATGTLAWTHQVTSLRDNLNGAYFDNDSLWVGIGGTLTKFSSSEHPDPGTGADGDAPVLVSVDGPAEVAAGDAVLLRWRLTDASGVVSTTAWIRGPRGNTIPSCGGTDAARSSGTALDGWYSQTCVIPASADSGTYTVTFESEDILGNAFSTVGHSLLINRSTTPAEPPTSTDIYEISQTVASKTTVSAGSRVSFSADVSVLMSDGTFSAAEDGVGATLQVQERGRWVDVAQSQSRGGTVEATARVIASAFYRFQLADGTVSAPVKIRALADVPDQLVVKWPTRVVSTFKVKVRIRSNGETWKMRETVVLALKPTGQSTWQIVDSGVTRRGKVTLSTKDLKSGTWRVSVAEHGLEDSRVYGSA